MTAAPLEQCQKFTLQGVPVNTSQLDCSSGGSKNPAFGLKNIVVNMVGDLMGGMCGMCEAHASECDGLDTRTPNTITITEIVLLVSIDCTMPTTLVAFITVRKKRFTILHASKNS